MAWWQPDPIPTRNQFRWTEAMKQEFADSFVSIDRQWPTRHQQIRLTQVHAELNGTEQATAIRCFGWFDLVGAALHTAGQSGSVPAAIDVARPSQGRPFNDFGYVKFATRRADSPLSDGFEVTLLINEPRAQALTAALSAHRAAWTPMLSVALAATKPEELLFPILHYSIATWPLNVGELDWHPWAESHLRQTMS